MVASMRRTPVITIAAVTLTAVMSVIPPANANTVTTSRVTFTHTGAQTDRPSASPSLSSDGQFVAFTSDVTSIVQGDTNNTTDVFLRDRRTGAAERISVDSAEKEARLTNPTKQPSIDPSIALDGRFVVYSSGAWNLAPGDTNELPDIFVRDRLEGTTERVSRGLNGAQPNGTSSFPVVSNDGRYVAFLSDATNLVSGDTNGAADVFLFDRQTATTVRANVRWDGAEVPEGATGRPAISADGALVAFYSRARIHPYDNNGIVDVYGFDRTTGTRAPLSLDNAGNFPNGNSWDDATASNPSISISPDARFVAFESGTPTLVSGDTNAARDIFVRDRTLATTERASVTWQGREITGASRTPSISRDGRFVAFSSEGVNVVAADANGVPDVFMVDRSVPAASRVSLTQGGSEGNNASTFPAMAADATATAFISLASNLVPNDTNAMPDIFVRGPILDPPPTIPTIYSPQEGTIVKSSSVPFQGTGQAGSSIRIVIAGAVVATTTVAPTGSWATSATLADGVYSFRAIASANGIDAAPTAPINFTVDTTPPPPTPPRIDSPSTGSATNVTSVPVSGTAASEASIDVFEGAVLLATTTATPSGTWTTSIPAAVGVHTIVALSNGTTSSNKVTFTVDQTAPAPPVITGPASGSTLYSNPITFTGTAEGKATVMLTSDDVSIGSAGAASNGSWLKASGIPEGSHVIVARARDAAGNLSAPSDPILVTLQADTAAPTVAFDDLRYTGRISRLDADMTGVASDNLRVMRVEIVIKPYGSQAIEDSFNATCVGCGTTAATWTATLNLPPGAYNIYANAVDVAELRSLTDVRTVVVV